ncbi:helix-turn-helix domain-containing protein [Moorella sp. Hama-1]|uniref:helix-turn-helix domain-containing protein n=1 Tax=Moorella sp. Hama-1 TaxID=2138101 RepID=UPI000D64BF60|nr:helix-turn-helix transcriptional regulator [Moorella sp. Hama-1]BCV20346.1 transcriptional regulator [Moorella sp. Hama-1]
MDVGKRIKQLREAAGLSMNQLARLAGVGQSTLSYIEMGQKNPTVDTLLLICKGLGVTPIEFFDGYQFNIPPDLRQLLREAESLTPSQRKKLVEFIRSMKGE